MLLLRTSLFCCLVVSFFYSSILYQSVLVVSTGYCKLRTFLRKRQTMGVKSGYSMESRAVELLQGQSSVDVPWKFFPRKRFDGKREIRVVM